MATKAKVAGVMSALKSRGSVGETKKGVNLLGIVKKLSEKRKSKQISGTV
jgi:hypothetical protein